jgi:eukaryotic-like serine/threonine-protein kinase
LHVLSGNSRIATVAELRDDLQTVLGARYSIERELGGGGMSRVFVAAESALGRQIVVKVLPADRVGGVSVERFRREILVAARLQHPHIVALLQTGEVAGLPYYTMPFVKGESLRARLARTGELSVNETIHILRDVAAALAYAHGEGVVHRDIKPDNVILSGGVAVVTDFGVAKAMDLAATDGHQATGLTSLGVALGTPAYMSPEQASADTHIDHRADVYSLGVMAYEMLTGASPFAGRLPHQMLAAHAAEVPESIAKRRPNLPAPLCALVMRCLEKHAGDRPQSAEDLVQALDAIATPSGGMAPTGARLRAVWRPRSWGISAGIAGVVLVLGGISFVLRAKRPPLLAVESLTQIRSSEALNFDASISPDGKFVAYAAGPAGSMRIFVRQVSGSSTVALSQGLAGDHRWPRWSPDGASIAFAAANRIYQVPALGGTPKLIVDRGDMPSWSPDGKSIVFVLGSAIWVRDFVSARSRQLDTGFQVNAPTWSPDGRRIAFVRGNSSFVGTTVFNSGLYGNAAPSAIWVVNVDGSRAKRVTDDVHLNTSPAWLPDSRGIVFVSNHDGSRDIYEQRLTSSGSPDGAPQRVTTGSNAFTLTLMGDGAQIAYSTLQLRSNIWCAPISTGPTPLSALRQVTNEKQAVEGVSISHDGQWLAFDSDLHGYHNLFKIPFTGGPFSGEATALTSDSSDAFSPRWSPGDSELVFHGLPFGSRDILTIRADGQGRTRLTTDPGHEYYPDWAPDGRRVVYTEVRGTGRDIYVVERNGRGWGAPHRVNDLADSITAQIAQIVRWSPDGELLGLLRENGLWLLRLDGKGMRAVVRPEQIGEAVTSVAWPGDARTIMFQSRDSSGVASFWRIDLAGGRPQRLLRLNEPNRRTRRVEFDADGRYLFFTISSDEADVMVAKLKAR